jgi:hypothetical protein
VQRRKIAGICALYKAYSGEPAWKAICDRLQRPYYLSWGYHYWKIRNRRQRRDIWNKLPMNASGTFPSKSSTFRKRDRKVISEAKESKVK